MVITIIIHKVAWELLGFRLGVSAFRDRNADKSNLPWITFLQHGTYQALSCLPWGCFKSLFRMEGESEKLFCSHCT